MENALWKLADVIDAFHTWVVIPFLIINILVLISGKLWGRYRSMAIVYGMMGSQLLVAGYPLTWLSAYLRTFKDPAYDGFALSLTRQVYETLGPFNYLRFALAGGLFTLATWLWRRHYTVRRQTDTSPAA